MDIQSRKDFKMVQVPADGTIAGINAKPPGGQRIRYLLNVVGCWHSEDQIRVGEYERREYEDNKNFAGKVTQIAKMRFASLEFLWAWLEFFLGDLSGRRFGQRVSKAAAAARQRERGTGKKKSSEQRQREELLGQICSWVSSD